MSAHIKHLNNQTIADIVMQPWHMIQMKKLLFEACKQYSCASIQHAYTPVFNGKALSSVFWVEKGLSGVVVWRIQA